MLTFLHCYQHLALLPGRVFWVDWEAYPVQQLCFPGFWNALEQKKCKIYFYLHYYSLMQVM